MKESFHCSSAQGGISFVWPESTVIQVQIEGEHLGDL